MRSRTDLARRLEPKSLLLIKACLAVLMCKNPNPTVLRRSPDLIESPTCAVRAQEIGAILCVAVN